MTYNLISSSEIKITIQKQAESHGLEFRIVNSKPQNTNEILKEFYNKSISTLSNTLSITRKKYPQLLSND